MKGGAAKPSSFMGAMQSRLLFYGWARGGDGILAGWRARCGLWWLCELEKSIVEVAMSRGHRVKVAAKQCVSDKGKDGNKHGRG